MSGGGFGNALVGRVNEAERTRKKVITETRVKSPATQSQPNPQKQTQSLVETLLQAITGGAEQQGTETIIRKGDEGKSLTGLSGRPGGSAVKKTLLGE